MPNTSAAFDSVKARIPFWSAISHAWAAVAEALTYGRHTADELVHIILRHAAGHGDPDTWYRSSEHGLPQLWLANLIRYGKEMTDGPWGPQGWATLRFGPRAGAAASEPVSSDLPHTSDPGEMLRRAEDPHAYTYAGNATVEPETEIGKQTLVDRSTVLESALADPALGAVARNTLRVLKLTGDPTDPLDFAELSFAEFCSRWSTSGGTARVTD